MAHRKPFAVVLFQRENNYATVPSSWVSPDKSTCFWPPLGTKNVSQLIQDSLSSPAKSWKGHRVSYTKFYGKRQFIVYIFNYNILILFLQILFIKLKKNLTD